MNYFDFNPGDFYSLVQGMDFDGQGIAISLISRLATTEKPIKTQWVKLGFPVDSQKKAMDILEALFVETPDGWIFPSVWQQVLKYQANCARNKENGRKGGRPKKNVGSEIETQKNPTGCDSVYDVNPKESLTNNQKPITNNQEVSKEKREKKPLVFPADLPADVRDEWVAYKKKMCRSCTQRMVDDIVEQARLAGMSLADAMVYQMKKGWKGFEAEWVRSSSPTGSSKAFNPDPDYFDEEPF